MTIVEKISCVINTAYLRIRHGKSIEFKGILHIPLGVEVYINNGKFLMGGVRALKGVKFSIECGGLMRIGDGVFFNRNSTIACRGKIDIGDHSVFGPNVCIYDHDHAFGINGITDAYKNGMVVIEKNCWIGAGAIILRNTHIGEGCVIGAGSIVKGEVSAHSIVMSGRELHIKSIAQLL